MRVAVVGTGYVGLVTDLPGGERQRGRLRRQGRQQDRRARAGTSCRSTSPACGNSCIAIGANDGCSSPPTRRGDRQGARSSSSPSARRRATTAAPILSGVWAVGDAIAAHLARRESSSSRAPCRSAPIAQLTERHGRESGPADRRGQQPGIPQGRGRHRRFHEARPRRRRRAPAGSRATCCRSCTARSCAPNGLFW